MGTKLWWSHIRTGSMGMAAVQSNPDGILEYMEEFKFDFQKY